MVGYEKQSYKLQSVKQVFNSLLSSVPDFILIKDGEGRWIFASDFTLSLFGLDGYFWNGKTTEQLSKAVPGLLYRNIFSSFARAEAKAWSTRKMYRSEVTFFKANGQPIKMDIVMYPVFNQNGNKRALISIGRDITNLQRPVGQKEHPLLHHDPVTQLPNRSMFKQEMERQIVISSALQQQFDCMFLNIDRFKSINNSLGTTIGDRLLADISERIKKGIPDDSFLASMGGDEFAILLPNVVLTQTSLQIAQRIMKSLNQPFHVDAHELFLTASIGLSRFPHDGRDVQTLMKHTNVALAQAKKEGKNRILLFNSNMDEASYHDFSLENRLKKAFSDRQFELRYQPKIKLGSSRIVGAEALLRWNDPESGYVPPDQFIPVAEESGLIIPLGRWIFQTVCEQIITWQKAGFPIVPISVNVSAKQFMHEDFVRELDHILRMTDVDPKYIEIEITERSIIENEADAIEVINQLADLGISVSLDDFGTGYSALSNLKQFKVSAIKIDRSFVKDIGIHDKTELIIKGMIQIAKSLNMLVIAEGVETEKQIDLLEQYQCDFVQGYLYSEPLKTDEFIRLLNKDQNGYSKLTKKSNVEVINRRNFYRITLTYPLLGEMTIAKFMGKDLSLGKSEVLIWDIGLGGLSFASNINITVRPDIILKLSTKILGHDMNFVGNMVWSRKEEDDIYRYGMEFLIKEDEREEIAKILNIFSVKINQHPMLPDSQFVATDSNYYLKSLKRS